MKKYILLFSLLGLIICSCSKDSNEYDVTKPQQPQEQETVENSKIDLPVGTDLKIDDITVLGDGQVMKINDDGSFSSTPECLIALNDKDEIVYFSYGSGDEERLLGSVETALALLIPTVPHVINEFDAEHLQAFKIMVALLKPTYNLVQAIEESIVKYNYLNMDFIQPQLIAAVKELHHRCGIDKESIVQEQNDVIARNKRNQNSSEQPKYPFFSASNAKRFYYDFITVDMTDAQLKENEGKKYWACKFDVFNDNRFCYTSFTKSIKNGNTFYRYDSSWADTFRYLIKPYNLSEFMDLGLVSDLAYDPEHFLTTLVDYDYSKILEDRAIAQFWEPFAKNRISTYDKTVKRNIEIDLFAADEHLLVVGPGMDDNLLLFNIVKIIVQPILKAVIKEHKKSKDYNEGTELDKFTSDFIEWIATSDLTFRADLLQHFKDPNNSFWEKVEYVWDKLSERVEKYVMDQLYDTASETAVVLLFEESGKLALKAH